MEAILSATGGVIIVAIGVTILIFVHELGHFIMAKRAKVRVEAFSLGFGPKLLAYKKGDTEYRLCLIPLGGYVKMAGESLATEDHTGAPDEFISKPPLTRIPIFMAGVIMNFLFAFPACILMYLIGVNFSYPVIGNIVSSSSEFNSLLKEGDKIISVNNFPILSLEDYRREMIRFPKGTEADVLVERGENKITVKVTALGSEKLGVLPLSNVVRELKEDSPAAKNGLIVNDEIVEIDGITVCANSNMNYLVDGENDKPLNIKVRRYKQSLDGAVSSEIVPLTLTPSKISFYAVFTDADVAQVVIDKVFKESPAEFAGLKPGDKIVSINETVLPSIDTAMKIIKSNAGKPVLLNILRTKGIGFVEILRYPGIWIAVLGIVVILLLVGYKKLFPPKTQSKGLTRLFITIIVVISLFPLYSCSQSSPPVEEEIKIAVIPKANIDGTGSIGVGLGLNNVLREISANSPLESAGLKVGDIILFANGKKINNIIKLKEIALNSKGETIEVTVQRGKDRINASLIPQLKSQWTFGMIMLSPKTVRQKYGLGKAIVAGTRETLDLFGLTIQLIGKLFTGEESTKGLAGPVRIFEFSYLVVTKEGISKFLWLLALFSLSLAIFNLLPIPILDGGGILFTLIEKIKGSPVNIKVQIVAQYIGLFVILSLVFFVTYNYIFNRG